MNSSPVSGAASIGVGVGVGVALTVAVGVGATGAGTHPASARVAARAKEIRAARDTGLLHEVRTEQHINARATVHIGLLDVFDAE